VFTGRDEGTSILVTQKQKVAFKMFVQEKQNNTTSICEDEVKPVSA